MSEKLDTSSTRINNKTLDALKTLKRKWKKTNLSEVIDKLMTDHKNFEDRIQTLESRLQAPTPPVVEAPIPKETSIEKTVAEMPTIQTTEQQCPYYSFNRPQSLVHCSKDFDTKGVIHRIPQEVCDLCFVRVQNKKNQIKDDADAALANECLCRFDHGDEFFCALKAPTVRRLEYGLKTCKACPDRLTEEKIKEREAQGEFTETKRYITCGAQEKQDSKVGILVWNSKNPYCPHQGYAVPLAACFDSKCSYAKLVQVIPKK